MNTKTIRTSLAAAAITGVIGVGAVVPALAQDSTPSEETTDDTATTREERHAEREAAFAAALAEELGLDEQQVADAIATVREELRAEHRAERRAMLEERLAEAVANGDLTQEQADALLAAFDSDVLPFGRGRHHHRRGGFGPGLGLPETDASSTSA